MYFVLVVMLCWTIQSLTLFGSQIKYFIVTHPVILTISEWYNSNMFNDEQLFRGDMDDRLCARVLFFHGRICQAVNEFHVERWDDQRTARWHIGLYREVVRILFYCYLSYNMHSESWVGSDSHERVNFNSHDKWVPWRSIFWSIFWLVWYYRWTSLRDQLASCSRTHGALDGTASLRTPTFWCGSQIE